MIAAQAQHISKDRVRSLQRGLYQAAKQNATRRFGVLYDKVMRNDVLNVAWSLVAANNGACGVDGQRIAQIKHDYGVKRFLQELREELRTESYEASFIRRVYIPKDNGKQRPLGIPTVKDRVTQMAVKLVIEPLFEVDFCDCSYGFRPERSNQDAAKEVHKVVNSHKHVVVTDLSSYFDTIPHPELLELVRQRVSDKRVLHLIRCWLKAGILEDGCVSYGTAGTPQGGVLSPLLSNIYLHELDRTWDPADGKLIRYADDFLILCRTAVQAATARERVFARLDELSLTYNSEKSTICHVKDGFEFLGFHYREAWSARLGRRVRIKFPRPKAQKNARARIKQRLQQLPLGADLHDAIKTVKASLRGWGIYFRIGNSYEAAESLLDYTCDQLRLFLRRRNQCKETRATKRWPNAFFHHRGLYHAKALLK